MRSADVATMSAGAARVVRTDAARFEGLPGWPYKVRIAYYDLVPNCSGASERETVLLTHGEPSWSYLNRNLVPPLLDQGYRVVLFDQVGFGQSDKPVSESDYSYYRHVMWNEDLLINHLNLKDITAVFQDWGGLLGLRVVARNPTRFARFVVANTFLPTGDNAQLKVNDGFYNWKNFVHKTGLRKEGTVGRVVGRGAAGPSNPKLSAAEIAAYDAPFPTEEHKAGARIFPELVPTPDNDQTGRPQDAGREENKAAWAVLTEWRKPVLCAFASDDIVMKGGDQVWLDNCPGTKGQPHVQIPGCGHFLQDGGSDNLSAAVITFIQANPLMKSKI